MAVSRGYLKRDLVAVRVAPEQKPDMVSNSVSRLADDSGDEDEEEEEEEMDEDGETGGGRVLSWI